MQELRRSMIPEPCDCVSVVLSGPDAFTGLRHGVMSCYIYKRREFMAGNPQRLLHLGDVSKLLGK